MEGPRLQQRQPTPEAPPSPDLRAERRGENNLNTRYTAMKTAKVTRTQDIDMEDAEASSRAQPAKGGGKRR